MKKFKILTLDAGQTSTSLKRYRSAPGPWAILKLGKGNLRASCIVNTCTVTDSADSSSRHQIRALLRDHPDARVAVTGCMAESAPDAIRAIDERILVIPNGKKRELVDELFPDEEAPEFQIKTFDAHTRAFVKVQDGCNSFCTYCIIPYVRGRSRSRSIDDVLEEVKGLIQNGFKEVVLTGINIGDFDGNGSGAKLADLVRAVDALPGLERLRISSIDPDEIDDDLADAVLNGKTTCPSMHIVLQAGSNVTLKRMNRKYTRKFSWKLWKKWCKNSPILP